MTLFKKYLKKNSQESSQVRIFSPSCKLLKHTELLIKSNKLGRKPRKAEESFPVRVLPCFSFQKRTGSPSVSSRLRIASHLSQLGCRDFPASPHRASCWSQLLSPQTHLPHTEDIFTSNEITVRLRILHGTQLKMVPPWQGPNRNLLQLISVRAPSRV